MMESMVYTDRFTRDFDSAAEFFRFMSERRSNSEWTTAPSRDLAFKAVEKDTPMGDLYLQLYNARGEGGLMLDTMENTKLMMNVNGNDYPVRSCAIKTILERARISGNALTKVTAEVMSKILNYCMNVASGKSLVKIADEKISAVHGGDEKDYAILEMLSLFETVTGFLDREFPGNEFLTAHFDHSIVTAVWSLAGQADDILNSYHKELIARNIPYSSTVPALRFTTSDTGASGANLYPVLLVGSTHRILPLGYPIKTEHKYGVDHDYFRDQLKLLYAKFWEAMDRQVKLMDIEIRYPVATMLGVLKRIGAPKKASYEALDEFMAVHGDDPCTAYEIYIYISEIIFYSQRDGASGSRVSQLEEITARALRIDWTAFDRPGEFKW